MSPTITRSPGTENSNRLKSMLRARCSARSKWEIILAIIRAILRTRAISPIRDATHRVSASVVAALRGILECRHWMYAPEAIIRASINDTDRPMGDESASRTEREILLAMCPPVFDAQPALNPRFQPFFRQERPISTRARRPDRQSHRQKRIRIWQEPSSKRCLPARCGR